MTKDVGLRLLDSLYEQMMIDDQWAVRRERGFTWWAFRVAQHVEVGTPVAWGEVTVCPVRIWTEVVRDVDPATAPATVVGRLNTYATFSALVWNEDEATITECCTAVVTDENIDWLSKLLATAAVLQNTASHSRAHGLAGLTGGTPAGSNHPASGERPAMDDLLQVPERVVMVEGAEPSRFGEEKFAGVGDFLREMNFLGFVDESGLTCEVPFTGTTPIAALEEGQQPQTSLVQMLSAAPHPEAGNGLLCLMRLPYAADPAEVAALANMLNATEAQGNTNTMLLGAWCPQPNSDTTLAFCSFVPNLVHTWVLVENLVSYFAAHSMFAAEQLVG